MKTKIALALILLFFLALSGGDNRFVSASAGQKRVKFQITTVGEKAGERKILAQTTVEGLPGTDFNINLHTGNFKMRTRFLSDLVAEDKLKIRAHLDTRRYYGRSPADLPLYEEDIQKHTLQVGFDEQIVLLPFGRGGGEEILKIEITPALLNVSKQEAAAPLRINFDRPLPGGEIQIEAFKVPHRFHVETALTADGEIIAKGSANFLLEEESELILQPIDGAQSQFFTAKLAIDKFVRNRPADQVAINYSFYKKAKDAGGSEPVILMGSGVGSLEKEFALPLDAGNLPKGKTFELRFKVRLADGENEN